MTCEDDATNTYQYVSDDFALATEFDGTALTNNLEPGIAYAVVMDATAGGDCSANSVGINSQVTLWIHVENGGSTYETLSITDTSRGAQVI